MRWIPLKISGSEISAIEESIVTIKTPRVVFDRTNHLYPGLSFRAWLRSLMDGFLVADTANSLSYASANTSSPGLDSSNPNGETGWVGRSKYLTRRV